MGNEDRITVLRMEGQGRIMVAQVGDHLMRVHSPSGYTQWSLWYDTDRWFDSIAEAERHHEARSDFLDELAGLFAIAIGHGVTEEELRADFEAQLSMQDFGDQPEATEIHVTTLRGAVAAVFTEIENSRWSPSDAERHIKIDAQRMTAEGGVITAPWTYTEGMSSDHGTVKANGDGSFTVELVEHPGDSEDFPYQRFQVNKDGSVDMITAPEPGPNYNR